MAARTLDIVSDHRAMLAGLVAFAVGAALFLSLAVLTLTSDVVSGAWLLAPSVLMALGVAAVTGWLVFRADALPSHAVEPSASWWREATTER